MYLSFNTAVTDLDEGLTDQCHTEIVNKAKFESNGFPSQIAGTNKLESNHHVNKLEINVTSSINQMVIQ